MGKATAYFSDTHLATIHLVQIKGLARWKMIGIRNLSKASTDLSSSVAPAELDLPKFHHAEVAFSNYKIRPRTWKKHRKLHESRKRVSYVNMGVSVDEMKNGHSAL